MMIELLSSRAGKAYLVGIALSRVDNLYAEVEDPDTSETSPNIRTPPCVIFFGSDAAEYPFGSGNWNLNLHARVVADEETTADDFLALCEEVFGNLRTDTIAEDLSSALSGFHCFGFFSEPYMIAQSIEGRMRISEMVLPINCCPMDITS